MGLVTWVQPAGLGDGEAAEPQKSLLQTRSVSRSVPGRGRSPAVPEFSCSTPKTPGGLPRVPPRRLLAEPAHTGRRLKADGDPPQMSGLGRAARPRQHGASH